MKLVCFGLPLAPLLLLADGHDVALCVLSPGLSLGQRRLRRLLPHRVLPVNGVEATIEQELRDADLLVSWFWTRRLPQRWLDLPRLGGIGVHPSLLPRHRGPDPYYWAIDQGDELTGVSAHRLTDRYDEGAVLGQATLTVGERDAWQLARALDRPSLRVLRQAVRHLERGTAIETPQDSRAATWAPEPQGDELRVDWRWPTLRVLRRIRALSPVPGLAVEIRGVRFFVTRAASASHIPAALHPGEAMITSSSVLICTGDGAIVVQRAHLTPESGETSETGLGQAELAGLFTNHVVLDSSVGGL